MKCSISAGVECTTNSCLNFAEHKVNKWTKLLLTTSHQELLLTELVSLDGNLFYEGPCLKAVQGLQCSKTVRVSRFDQTINGRFAHKRDTYSTLGGY